MSIADNIKSLKNETDAIKVSLLAVSKTKPVDDLKEAYDAGQRLFGENTVQEMVEKQEALPKDIEWHMIGHLQSNKVKFIAPFVTMIQSVDSIKLLQEIDKHAAKNKRVIDCLLQIYIADEETKFGLDEKELFEFLDYYDAAQVNDMKNVRICGVMGMATDTDNKEKVRLEFAKLKGIFRNLEQSYFLAQDYFRICSMGMSGDYKLAIEEGSTMVRIGSMLFGQRNYTA